MRNQPDRTTIPFAASVIVLMGGVTACLAIIMLYGEATPPLVAAVISGGVLMAVFLWLLRDRPEAIQRQKFQWVFWKRSKKHHVTYSAGVIREKPESFGTNKPASVEEVREMKENVNSWVPSRQNGSRNRS